MTERAQDSHVAASESRRVEDREPGSRAGPPPWLLALNDHIEVQVAFGDTKAGLLLTADSILLAGMATAFGGDRPLVDRPAGPSHVLAALALTALSAGLIAALMTVLPNRRNLWPRAGAPQNRFNFSWIASQRLEDYRDAVREEDGDVTAELAASVHGKSTWARRKFVRLYVAVCATMLGLVLALGAVAAVAL